MAGTSFPSSHTCLRCAYPLESDISVLKILDHLSEMVQYAGYTVDRLHMEHGPAAVDTSGQQQQQQSPGTISRQHSQSHSQQTHQQQQMQQQQLSVTLTLRRNPNAPPKRPRSALASDDCPPSKRVAFNSPCRLCASSCCSTNSLCKANVCGHHNEDVSAPTPASPPCVDKLPHAPPHPAPSSVTPAPIAPAVSSAPTSGAQPVQVHPSPAPHVPPSQHMQHSQLPPSSAAFASVDAASSANATLLAVPTPGVSSGVTTPGIPTIVATTAGIAPVMNAPGASSTMKVSGAQPVMVPAPGAPPTVATSSPTPIMTATPQTGAPHTHGIPTALPSHSHHHHAHRHPHHHVPCHPHPHTYKHPHVKPHHHRHHQHRTRVAPAHTLPTTVAMGTVTGDASQDARFIDSAGDVGGSAAIDMGDDNAPHDLEDAPPSNGADIAAAAAAASTAAAAAAAAASTASPRPSHEAKNVVAGAERWSTSSIAAPAASRGVSSLSNVPDATLVGSAPSVIPTQSLPANCTASAPTSSDGRRDALVETVGRTSVRATMSKPVNANTNSTADHHMNTSANAITAGTRGTSLTNRPPPDLLCVPCSTRFESELELRRHEFTQHKDERVVSRTAEGRYLCLMHSCTQSFVRRHVMERHFKTVHLMVRDFPCESCNRAFADSSTREAHRSAVHQKRKPWVCNQCSTCFTQSSSLGKHRRRFHQDMMTSSIDNNNNNNSSVDNNGNPLQSESNKTNL